MARYLKTTTRIHLGTFDMDWNPSPKFLASSAHVGWAALAILSALHHGLPLAATVGVFTLYAVLKEYWADITWLEQDTLAGTTLDFVTYLLGEAIGAVAFFAFWWAVPMAVGVLVVMAALDYQGFFRLFGKAR